MILGTVHLDGPPVPKSRPRFVQAKTGRVHTYTPPKTVAYEEEIGKAWHGPRSFTGAVKVTVAVIEGVTAHPGDLDNYVKTALDALNRIAWCDDEQVCVIAASIIRGNARPGLDVLVEGFEAAQEGQGVTNGTAAAAVVVRRGPPKLVLRRGRGR